MRSAQNRVFRVERNNRQTVDNQPHIVCDNTAAMRHAEVMEILDEIRQRADSPSVAPAPEAMSQQVIETCQRDLREAQKIKDELQQIHEAIARTKKEIATLYRGEYQGIKVGRMTNELGAIVDGTEQATETILLAAEQIDNDAADLVAALRQSQNHATASDIQDQVVKIFEACNFQDLTGQRISKVVTAFGFIEDRVDRMMEIWGGLESFKEMDLDASCTRDQDESLLNGPALEDDENIASQDDIDALFD